jgi:hypothetical protein
LRLSRREKGSWRLSLELLTERVSSFAKPAYCHLKYLLVVGCQVQMHEYGVVEGKVYRTQRDYSILNNSDRPAQ